MFTQEDVDILKSALPKGSAGIIQERTGISAPTVHRFLRVGKIKLVNQKKIYAEALKLIEMEMEETNRIIRFRNKLLGTGTATKLTA
ncbi:MAG: hypothetical protein IT236_06505 [Bacteroidia bacterium]|nr:hypothetical protein [Bacteroidia bacterium]